MPFYEYSCPQCGTHFDLMRRMADRDEPAPCPKCGGTQARRELPRVTATIRGGDGGTAACGAPASECGSSSFG